jgi:uncharacterized protein
MRNVVSVAIAPAALIFIFLVGGAVIEPQPAPGSRPPIIDMHLHAMTQVNRRMPNCADPRTLEYDRVMTCGKWLPTSASDEALMKESLERLERFNIWAVTSSDDLDRVTAWRAASAARIIPAIHFTDRDRTPEELRRLVTNGRVAVFAEVEPQYRGLRADDEISSPTSRSLRSWTSR